MQREVMQAVLVASLSGNGYLFDGAGVIIMPGPRQRNLRRIGLAGLNEKILADTDRLALFKARHMVDAVVIHADGAAIDIILAASKMNLLAVVELDLGALQGPVRRDFELGLGARDGSQIAAALLDLGRHAGPGRVMVGDADLLHRGQI